LGLLLRGDIHNPIRDALRTRIGRDLFVESVRSVPIGTLIEVPIHVEDGLH
jgi:hypothetical protein